MGIHPLADKTDVQMLLSKIEKVSGLNLSVIISRLRPKDNVGRL